MSIETECDDLQNIRTSNVTQNSTKDNISSVETEKFQFVFKNNIFNNFNVNNTFQKWVSMLHENTSWTLHNIIERFREQ